jgi:Lar family restriction alleviation protein
MNKLKPCPFCGGKAEIIETDTPRTDDIGDWKSGSKYYHRAACTNCETSGPYEDSKELAIKAWNKRVL